MSVESFLSRKPKWLQILIAALFFGGCISIIAFKINSSLASEEPQSFVPNVNNFKIADSGDWSNQDREAANKALAIWAKQCPAYMKYPDEVTLQKVSIEKNNLGAYGDYGWSRFVRIETIAALHPHKLMKISPYISGQHCLHDVGIDGDIGLWVAKTGCLQVCGGEEKDPNSLGKFFPIKQY